MSFGAAASGWFALAPEVDLLNHGSFGACPREVLAAQRRERDAMEAHPIRYMEQVGARLRAVAGQLGRRVGARADDLVFVDNATSGVNTVLRSLVLRPGDRLVTTTHVYGAVRNALHHVAQRSGATVVEVPVPFPLDDPQQVVAALRPHLAGARLAVVDAITSPTGLVLPVAGLVAACRDAGVPVLVDAAHAPGHVPLDLEALGADWVTGNLHKWSFAAKGSAFLWARRDRQALVPLSVSHDLALGFPHAFDWTGTKDVSAWLSLPAAWRFVDALGEDRIQAYNNALCADMAAQLADQWGVVLPAPHTMRAAMAAIPAPGDLPAHHAEALRLGLRARGIEVPCIPFAGRTWVRISAQIYNHPEPYGRLGRAVLELLG